MNDNHQIVERLAVIQEIVPHMQDHRTVERLATIEELLRRMQLTMLEIAKRMDTTDTSYYVPRTGAPRQP
jgi:hypothetical protein